MSNKKIIVAAASCFIVLAVVLTLQIVSTAKILSSIYEEGTILSQLPAGDAGLYEITDESTPLSGGTLTEAEKYAAEVLELVNAERVKAGAGTLEGTGELYAAANLRAKELAKTFSHNRPDGSLCFTVLKEFNISSSARAENIAGNFKSPQQVVSAWMKSEGHRKNILNAAYKKIGIGVYTDSAGKLSWVQLFTD